LKKKPAKKAVAKKAVAPKAKAKTVKKAAAPKKTKITKKTISTKSKTSKASAKPAPKAAAQTKKPIKSAAPSKKTTLTKSQGPKAKAWMKPLDDRILVELVDAEQVSPGGIILVDSSIQPENLEGYVTAIGRGHQNKKGRIRPVELKVGDKVLFSKYAGDKVSHNGVNFVIIRESEVLGFAAN
jgi:chaperonin GroES